MTDTSQSWVNLSRTQTVLDAAQRKRGTDEFGKGELLTLLRQTAANKNHIALCPTGFYAGFWFEYNGKKHYALAKRHSNRTVCAHFPISSQADELWILDEYPAWYTEPVAKMPLSLITRR